MACRRCGQGWLGPVRVAAGSWLQQRPAPSRLKVERRHTAQALAHEALRQRQRRAVQRRPHVGQAHKGARQALHGSRRGGLNEQHERQSAAVPRVHAVVGGSECPRACTTKLGARRATTHDRAASTSARTAKASPWRLRSRPKALRGQSVGRRAGAARGRASVASCRSSESRHTRPPACGAPTRACWPRPGSQTGCTGAACAATSAPLPLARGHRAPRWRCGPSCSGGAAAPQRLSGREVARGGGVRQRLHRRHPGTRTCTRRSRLPAHWGDPPRGPQTGRR